MGIVVSWLVLSIIAGVIADQKGRSGIGFFFLSIVLSPLIGVIAALVVEPNVAEVEKAEIESGVNKKCPFCAEIIKQEAKVCRYCGRDLPASERVSDAPVELPHRDTSMERFGITFDGEKYQFERYAYEKLDDAVNYARLQVAKTKPCPACQKPIPTTAIMCRFCRAVLASNDEVRRVGT